MRIALISDIHGNLVSLEAVLADIERERVDQIICLGDVATLGPQPREVIARIIQLNCACVMGNHDFILLNPDQGKAYMDTAWFADMVEWCGRQLTPEDFACLRAFKPVLSIDLGGERLLCFHGSPHANTDNIMATTPPRVLTKMLAGYQAAVMAGGHTHIQMMRQHKGTLLVNPGSVGMPFEQMPFKGTPRILPWAEYAVVTWRAGALTVALRRLPIDLDAVKQAAFDSGMPDPAGWVENWVTPS